MQKKKPRFRRKIDINQMYDDIIKTAEIVAVPYDVDAIKRVLHAYEEYYSQSPVMFRTTTKPDGKRGLSVRYVELEVPNNPYPTAFAEGFLSKQDHPIDDLHPEFEANFAIAGYGVDLAVSTGLQKIWAFLPRTTPVDEVYGMSSWPEGVYANKDYFAKYGLTKLRLLAYDYRARSVNLYFIIQDPAKELSLEKVTRIISDLGIELPSQEILGYCSTAVSIYPTFNWDSPEIQRICFTVPAPMPEMMPTHLHPLLERYYAEAPILAEHRMFVFSPTPARDGFYLKMENDYTGTMVRLIQEGVQDLV